MLWGARSSSAPLISHLAAYGFLQAGNHKQQDVDFLIQKALKLTYEHL
jgi:hypothetical protein